MTNQVYFEIGAYVCLALMIGLPIYLITFKDRFWYPFFLAWSLMVAGQALAVSYEMILYDHALTPPPSRPSDTTTVGLTLFGGWLIVLPYCFILKVIRDVLRYLNVLPLQEGEPAAGQPPIQPADKAPAKDQTSPPMSKGASR